MSTLNISPEAVWIGSDHPFDLHEAYLCFRSPATWRLTGKPEQAKLCLTADSRYKLWVNGHFVARGPARSFPQHQAVDCLNLTNLLQPGPNTLAVQVYQPGYSHFSYVHRGAAGLLAWLECDNKFVLVTDTTWLTRRDPSFAANVPRVSIYGSGVEERDLNLADDWTSPVYDDSGWAASRLVAPIGGYPWLELRPRAGPLLVEREIPITLLETRLGHTSANASDPHLTLRESWFSARSKRPKDTLGVYFFTPENSESWFQVNLESGQSAYWLFDLGRNYTTQGWAEVKSAGGTEHLSISYQEKIRNGELIISDPQTYCRVRLTDRFKLRSGDQQAETFALRGGRYLVFQVIGPTGPDFQFRPHARVSEYPLDVTKMLPVEDPQLSDIITLCENTFRACLQDSFIDCNWRENSQWLGDALPQSLMMSSLGDDTRPLKQVIEMAAQGAYPDGVLPSVLPGEVHAYAVVDYNFTWAELLKLYFDLTGDDVFIGEMWATLLKMLNRFNADRNADGLIMSQPGRRLFLDWSRQSRSEPSAVYNLRYLLALQTAAQLADDRGLISNETHVWQHRAGQLREAIRRTFWHNNRWYDDPEKSTFSQLAASLAILTGVTQESEINVQVEAIAARSLDVDDEPAPGKMVLASPFGHHYIFEALRLRNRDETVVEIIRRRWGRWVEAGYPTAWENWNVDFPDGSQCHSFSAHPLYHLAQIAGEGKKTKSDF